MSDATKWTDVVSALSSSASVIATVGIAVVVERYRRAQERKDKREKRERTRREQVFEARTQNASGLSQIDDMIKRRLGVTQSWEDLMELPVVTRLRSQGVDSRAIIAQYDVLRGHLRLLDLALLPTSSWTRSLDDAETAAEAMSRALNGSLDVVTGAVFRNLPSDAGIRDGFFNEFEQPELIEKRQVEGESQSTLDEQVTRSVNRWVEAAVCGESCERFASLVRYKIQLEHALRIAFFGRFSDAEIECLSPRERYLIAVRGLTYTVRDELERQTEAALTALSRMD